MNKNILALAMALAFTVSTAAVGMAASSVKCKVSAIDGNTVTLDCKKASKLKVGMKVKVKESKKKAIEGC